MIQPSTIPALTQYETFALHCMPRLRQHVLDKVYAHGTLTHTILPATYIQQGLEYYKARGYYIHYCHTSPKQLESDIARDPKQEYTVSKRHYPAVGEAPELKVILITRSNV